MKKGLLGRGGITPIVCVMGLGLAMSVTRVLAVEGHCDGVIHSIPTAITTQGVWCLGRNFDLSLSSGSAITIATDDVTLDCRNLKLSNLDAGAWTVAYGILAENRDNLIIRNCNIRGFRRGISLEGGRNHVVESSSLDENRQVGIYVRGEGSTVRHNRVRDTGGTELESEIGATAAIYTVDNVEIQENQVFGVYTPESSDQNATGIHTENNEGSNVWGNWVREIHAADNELAEAVGIRNMSNGWVSIRNNHVNNDAGGDGPIAEYGVYCEHDFGTAIENELFGFKTSVFGCWTQGENNITSGVDG